MLILSMGKLSICVLSFLVILCLCSSVYSLFQFKRYGYRKKSGNERRYRLQDERCQNLEYCKNKFGLDKDRCVKMCVSSSCYEELYSWNELEEGEIDVRSSSFKGCVVKQVRAKELEEQRNNQL